MHNFKVWAPLAKTVDIVVNGQKVQMDKIEQWWQYDSDLTEQIDYGFIVDGKGPYPDPCSNFQPYGVNGFSRTFDHSLFQWTDQNWQSPPLSSAIIYELHTGTFTAEGTFEAIIERLDYLKELGITHIEIMPVNEFSGNRGWGYDGVNIYAPHHSYGGPEGLKKLVNACHCKNLGVILDVVYNHFGPEGNYLPVFGPYLTKKYLTFWGDAFNYDSTYSNVPRNFIIENALMWLEVYHADGLRLDAIHSIFDQSAINIFEQLSREVKKLESKLGRHLFLIAESDLNNPRVVQNYETGGFGFNAQWSDDFHHSLHSILTGETNGYYEDFDKISNLAKALKSVFVRDGTYSNFRKAVHGRKIERENGHNFLVYIQNHDQVGNRAKGNRIGQLISKDKAKIAAALVITSPFIPMLFQGEEFDSSSPFLYFTDVSDENLAIAITQGRQNEFAPFGWKPEEIPDPQSGQTFENSKLKWYEINEQPHKEMLEWYSNLIQLRKSYPELRDGSLENIKIDFDELQKWIIIKRGHLTIIANLSDEPIDYEIKKVSEVLLKSNKFIEITDSNINMFPSSVVILYEND